MGTVPARGFQRAAKMAALPVRRRVGAIMVRWDTPTAILLSETAWL